MTDEQLKPCPFCGAPAGVTYHSDYTHGYTGEPRRVYRWQASLHCTRCGLPHCSGFADVRWAGGNALAQQRALASALRAWNHRAIEAAATAPLLERIAEMERLRSEDLSHAVDMAATIEALEAKLAQRVPSVDVLTDKIASMLGLTYHCTRVWNAWNVGTMSQDDFEPVDESETPREIAEEIHAMLSAAPAAPEQQSEAEKLLDAAGLCRRCAAPKE